MKKIISLSLLVLFCYSSTLLGQASQKITIQDAIEIALENNFQLKQAENNLDLAEDNILNIKADFLPDLNANSSVGRGVGRTFNQVTGQVQDTPNNSFDFSVSTSMPIFTGFRNINSLRNAKEVKLSRTESLKRSKESVIFNTASRFLQVLLDQQLLQIAEQNLETSQKQLEQIQAQVEVGSRPIVDQYNQESQVASDELAVTQRENSLAVNKLLLIRQMQVDPLGQYEFVTPEIGNESVDNNEYDLKSLIDTALSSRSDIKSEEAGINAQRFNLAIAKGGVLPSLSLSARASSSYDQVTKDRFGVGFNDQFFDQNIFRSIGASLSIPIFNRLDRVYNIQSSKVQLKNAELDLENSKLQVVQEVTQAYTDYGSISKQLEASEKARIASEKAFETQQERYNVGASTLIELSQAQATYVQAQSNYTQALYNLIFQEKLLDFYLGKLSGEDVEF
jgi:outer membrane protein